MKTTYDPKHNIAYIRLHEKTSQVETLHVSEDVNMDMAPDGTIYGIELLNANEQLAGIPRLARGYHRQGLGQNFLALPDGNAQSNEIFGLAKEDKGKLILINEVSHKRQELKLAS